MQAGDLGEQRIAAVADFLGFQGGEPASLLLVEPTHQEIDLVMMPALRVIPTTAAVGAPALINRIGHGGTSANSGRKARRTLYE